MPEQPHPDASWERYGRALHAAMAEVLAEFPEGVRPHALETADHWLSLGIAIGLEHPTEAQRLLGLIEADEEEVASGACCGGAEVGSVSGVRSGGRTGTAALPGGEARARVSSRRGSQSDEGRGGAVRRRPPGSRRCSR